MSEKPEEHQWETGWDGHVDAQRIRLAALPLSEKLAWLEEAQRVVGALRQAAPAALQGEIAGPTRRA